MTWEPGAVAQPATGTGFLVPREEQERLAACTWTTSKWHHRSEHGLVMVRCFMKAPDATDDELVSLARAELAPLADLSAEPARTIVRQVPAALPVMQVGHRSRVAKMHERVDKLGGLALAGAGLEVSGLAACIRSGTRAAETTMKAMKETARS